MCFWGACCRHVVVTLPRAILDTLNLHSSEGPVVIQWQMRRAEPCRSCTASALWVASLEHRTSSKVYACLLLPIWTDVRQDRSGATGYAVQIEYFLFSLLRMSFFDWGILVRGWSRDQRVRYDILLNRAARSIPGFNAIFFQTFFGLYREIRYDYVSATLWIRPAVASPVSSALTRSCSRSMQITYYKLLIRSYHN